MISEKEKTILQLLREGKTRKEVAYMIEASRNSVDKFIKILFRKFGALNTAHLVNRAYEEGFLKMKENSPEAASGAV